jgi:tRNA pseudouridine synthase 10
VEAAHAAGEAFHGMGREDIDARMLGTGRPFVLELKSPQRRTLDLPSLAADVKRRSAGRVEAVDIVPTDPGAPARFKSADPDKSYLAACRAEGPVDPEQLRAVVAGLEGVHLEQRTPERVAHRRADLVRRRRILAIAVRAIDGDRFDVEIRAESGTYIKEFVSGDEGRTQPSLSQRLGQAVKVEALDVVAIHWPPPPPSGAADL